MDQKALVEMVVNAAINVGMVTTDQREQFIARTEAELVDPESESSKFLATFAEFGKLYTADIVAEYERQIETLKDQLDEADQEIRARGN